LQFCWKSFFNMMCTPDWVANRFVFVDNVVNSYFHYPTTCKCYVNFQET